MSQPLTRTVSIPYEILTHPKVRTDGEYLLVVVWLYCVEKQGSVLSSTRIIARETGVSASKVKRILAWLVDNTHIEREVTHLNSLFTIRCATTPTRVDTPTNTGSPRGTGKSININTNTNINTDPPTPHRGRNVKTRYRDAMEAADIREPCRAAWDEWRDYKIERAEYLLPSSVKKQAEKLMELNDAEVISCIDFSIAQGYQGLILDRFQGKDKLSASNTITEVTL